MLRPVGRNELGAPSMYRLAALYSFDLVTGAGILKQDTIVIHQQLLDAHIACVLVSAQNVTRLFQDLRVVQYLFSLETLLFKCPLSLHTTLCMHDTTL